VIAAGKPVYIDKPIAGTLSDAIEIFRLAERAKVPVFTASSLRFGSNTLAVRNGRIGIVTNAWTGSPAHVEKTHPDLFWYGVHGVESLFTVMGTGCVSVRRGTTPEGLIEVVGTWKGGRRGTFREGKGYEGRAEGTKGSSPVGAYDGYAPLIAAVVPFLKTGVAPVQPEETLEIFAFMEAADESKRRGGAEVTLAEVLEKARRR
jgi:predicted dehydrogenase